MDQELKDRLKSIEEKLDKHLEQVSKNTTDLTWVRGYIKTSIASIISLTIGLITTYMKINK